MRTIKFRGKNRDKNEWVNGDLVVVEDGMHNVVRAKIITHCFTKSFQGGGFDHYSISTLVEPKTIGQFTGLLDKNGKEIYEGDIIKIEEEGVVLKPKIVDFSDGMFGTREWSLAYYGEDIIEVIGNIHDNPELLKNND